MPIILNGTTFNNGGTVTFNGSTVKEIVFGTTTVWKAETTIYPGATVSNLTANSGSYSTANFSTQVGSGTNTSSTVLYVPIDLTDYTTITVTGTWSVTTVAGYSGCFISSASQHESYKTNQIRYPYYTIGQGASSTYYVRMQRINNTTGTVSSYTFDVSGLSGSHYLYIGCYFNNSSGGTAKAQITSITAQ